jgi:hypothetical protein
MHKPRLSRGLHASLEYSEPFGWDCINTCQRKGPSGAGLSPARPLLSSPCRCRLPQKRGALRLQPWSSVQRQTPRWRKPDSNPRSPRKGQHFFETAADLATTNRPGSQSRILTIDKGRFTVRRARLAPAMISTPGLRASRRRQRGALPAWSRDAFSVPNTNLAMLRLAACARQR